MLQVQAPIVLVTIQNVFFLILNKQKQNKQNITSYP